MAAAKRRCTSSPSVPVSFPAIWDWSRWGGAGGSSTDWFIGYAHFDARIRQYWEVIAAAAIGLVQFRDGRRVKLYTVNWDGWDDTNARYWFKSRSIIETVGLLWDPGNGRTVSLFVNGEFQAELWRDVPPEIYPVFNPRSQGNGRPSVRLQDIPTLENACYKKAMDLDLARLPLPLREQAVKRKKKRLPGFV